jgi:hypothetical protein
MAEPNSAGSNEKVMARAVFHEILKGRTRIPAVRNEDLKGIKEARIIIVCLCRGSPRE